MRSIAHYGHSVGFTRAKPSKPEDLNMLRATADVVTFFELQGWAAGNAVTDWFFSVARYPKS